MKKLLTILAIAFMAVASPVMQTGCSSGAPVTLAPGGEYSDPILATTDRAILDASSAIKGFIQWHAANEDYLRRWPDIGQLAQSAAANEKQWLRDAYAARDAYALAARAYREGTGSGEAADKNRAALKAAIVTLDNITTHIVQRRQERSTP